MPSHTEQGQGKLWSTAQQGCCCWKKTYVSCTFLCQPLLQPGGQHGRGKEARLWHLVVNIQLKKNSAIFKFGMSNQSQHKVHKAQAETITDPLAWVSKLFWKSGGVSKPEKKKKNKCSVPLRRKSREVQASQVHFNPLEIFESMARKSTALSTDL